MSCLAGKVWIIHAVIFRLGIASSWPCFYFHWSDCVLAAEGPLALKGMTRSRCPGSWASGFCRLGPVAADRPAFQETSGAPIPVSSAILTRKRETSPGSALTRTADLPFP